MRENKSWRDSDEFKIEESFSFICLDSEACEEGNCNDCEGAAAIINPWIFIGTVKQVQEIIDSCHPVLTNTPYNLTFNRKYVNYYNGGVIKPPTKSINIIKAGNNREEKIK